jgi:hypothetical protein
LVTFSLLFSGIQTPMSLLLEGEDGYATVIPEINNYRTSEITGNCGCDDSGSCVLPSSLYNISMVDDQRFLTYWVLQPQLSLKNWVAGCWALESLLRSSFDDSFLDNQTALDVIGSYFNWSSNSMSPIALNLNRSNNTNESSGTFNDLLDNLFVENLLTELSYSAYFEQCRAQFCFYLIKQHSSVLYIFTLLLALYGGLSVVLRFLIPDVVAFVVKRLKARDKTFPITGE